MVALRTCCRCALPWHIFTQALSPDCGALACNFRGRSLVLVVAPRVSRRRCRGPYQARPHLLTPAVIRRACLRSRFVVMTDAVVMMVVSREMTRRLIATVKFKTAILSYLVENDRSLKSAQEGNLSSCEFFCLPGLQITTLYVAPAACLVRSCRRCVPRTCCLALARDKQGS
jgi:hypothetical protein